MNHPRAVWRFRISGARSLVACLALLTTASVLPARGQRRTIERDIRTGRERLNEIRRQRQELESELQRLRSGARSVSTELQNLDRQRTATSRLVSELDRQISGLSTQLDSISFDLILAEDALAERQAVLDRRIVDIYKRGPLWAFEVLLAAESFGDLVSRYKYLYLVSRQDRSMVEEIDVLRDRIAGQRSELLAVRHQVASQRDERDSELQEYVNLERDRQQTLQRLQQTQRRTASEIASLLSDEETLNTAIADLERRRRAAVSSGPAEATISDADLGRLEWPVEGGRIVYEFGREGFRDGTAIRHQGVGIGVPVGTEVHAVRGGEVRSITPVGTFGPQVWIYHGAGFWTGYLYLSRVTVRTGQQVGEGEVIGQSGGANSDDGPHIQFQIRRTPANAPTPIAVDPLNWLRRRN